MTKDIGNKARSIIYIFIISGLLSSTALIILLVWNSSFSSYFEMSEITFLEAVGLVSFVYVIYYGIRFGHSACHNDVKTDISADGGMSNDIMSENDVAINTTMINKMTDDEQKELKHFLARCCGMSINISQKHSSFGRKPQAKDI